MSEALYKFGGLRFWNAREIALREEVVRRLSMTVADSLLKVNRSWEFQRIEGPLITPRGFINPEYDESDVWDLSAKFGDDGAAMRPETTASSYLYAEHLLKSGASKLPLCVWQSGKSFRRETNDGASAAKLRFNEFYQLEFQCMFAENTKANYETPVTTSVQMEIGKLTNSTTRVIQSDRLPSYSKSTMDIEVWRERKGRHVELCSISIRKDFERARVLEIAIGLDRIVSVMEE